MKGSQLYYTPSSFIYYSEQSLHLQKEDAVAAQFSEFLKLLVLFELLTVKKLTKHSYIRIIFSRLYTVKSIVFHVHYSVHNENIKWLLKYCFEEKLQQRGRKSIGSTLKIFSTSTVQ